MSKKIMKLLSFKQNCYLKPLLMLCFFILILSTSSIVRANGATDDKDIIGNKLCNIVGILSGKTVKALCLVAILALGITTFMGRVNMSTAIITVSAIVIVTQSSTVLKFISGNDASDCKAEQASSSSS